MPPDFEVGFVRSPGAQRSSWIRLGQQAGDGRLECRKAVESQPPAAREMLDATRKRLQRGPGVAA
jgi:hypothetical protein